MFHVKHDLGHDPALEASDGFEYAPADAHNIGGPGPRSSPNRASILRPVAWCSRQPAVGGREEQSEPRDIPTGQTMPEAVRLHPKAWVPNANDPTLGGRKSRSNEGVRSRLRAWCCGARLWSRVRAACSRLGRGMIDCGVIRATNLPMLFDPSDLSCFT